MFGKTVMSKQSVNYSLTMIQHKDGVKQSIVCMSSRTDSNPLATSRPWMTVSMASLWCVDCAVLPMNCTCLFAMCQLTRVCDTNTSAL